MRLVLDEAARREHRRRNLLHSIFLTLGIGALLALAAYLLWGTAGVIASFLTVSFFFLTAPRLPPEAVMSLYRARRVLPEQAGQLTLLLAELAARAKLPRIPALYVIPSMTLNAFSTGSRWRSAIALTEGLLRRLSLREVAGVLAHEVSHIRNNDLWVMSLADMMTRLVQIMSYAAIGLAAFNVVAILTGEEPFSWIAILLLYFAPAISSLMQLGLSRAREYDADLEAVRLTGDPMGLASALARLDSSSGYFWEDLTYPVPGRRVPVPSLLRTHPSNEERIARLRDLVFEEPVTPIEILDEPLVTLVGMGPAALRPRFRWPGVWY